METGSNSGSRVYDLEDRLIDLAVAISNVCDTLASSRIGKHVASQLVRCGTAPAVLQAEARAAESRKDFIHKLGVCLKELRESMTWLRYVDRLGIGDQGQVHESIEKADRVIAIMYTSIQTARRNDKRTS